MPFAVGNLTQRDHANGIRGRLLHAQIILNKSTSLPGKYTPASDALASVAERNTALTQSSYFLEKELEYLQDTVNDLTVEIDYWTDLYDEAVIQAAEAMEGRSHAEREARATFWIISTLCCLQIVLLLWYLSFSRRAAKEFSS